MPKKSLKLESPPTEPRRLDLVRGRLSYHWLNRYGHYVRLDDIPDHGILRIFHILQDAEDRVPYCWISTVRDYALKRGIDIDPPRRAAG